MTMLQVACERCAQGVLDGDGPAGPGNDHLYAHPELLERADQDSGPRGAGD